jgi:hypothetical protein
MTRPSKFRAGSKAPGNTAKEHDEIEKRIQKRHQKLRNRFREIHGKVVDWVSYSFEQDLLFVNIRFIDKTDFSLQFSHTMFVDVIDLSDASTGNFETIREYYTRRHNKW